MSSLERRPVCDRVMWSKGTGEPRPVHLDAHQESYRNEKILRYTQGQKSGGRGKRKKVGEKVQREEPWKEWRESFSNSQRGHSWGVRHTGPEIVHRLV